MTAFSKPKALTLISGGLDSILAARLVKDEGVGVTGVGFRSHFFGAGAAEKSARSIGVPVLTVDISPEMIGLLESPRYGFGRHLNPCVDCHRLMVAKAFKLMRELGADFVVTGEVLGQRPKSQHRDALNSVAKAGERGLLLRPLSARLLAETVPEKKGWVRRSRMLDISGRGRKKQLELAESLGITEFTSPAGGCLLTDPEFCRRLKELREHEGLSGCMIALIKIGRHFRSPRGMRIVSGRNEKENASLEEASAAGDYLFQALSPASLVLLRAGGAPGKDDVTLAASICARYSKGKGGPMEIRSWRKGETVRGKVMNASPIDNIKLEELRI